MIKPLAKKNHLTHFSKPCLAKTGNAISVERLIKMYPSPSTSQKREWGVWLSRVSGPWVPRWDEKRCTKGDHRVLQITNYAEYLEKCAHHITHGTDKRH
jgi:hypothetical protein